MRSNLLLAYGVALVALGGCVGEIGAEGLPPGAPGPGPAGGPGGPGPGDPLPIPMVNCDGDGALFEQQLQRLTSAQFTNAAEDLTGFRLEAPAGFGDQLAGGFERNGSTDQVSRAQVSGYSAAAESLAQSMDTSHLFGTCNLSDRTCVEGSLRTAARLAFREPTPDITELVAVYDDGMADAWGPDESARAAVMTLLTSPRFLYRWEDSTGERAPIQGYAMASRLAFFLWSSIPDEDLMAAAGEGRLDTSEDLSAEALRMIADPRTHRTVRNYHRQWLHLDSPNAEDKHDLSFDSALAASMEAEAYAFVEAAFDGGGLRSLLTDSVGFVDSRMADYYGVAAPAGGGLQRTPLDANVRAGVMTLPRFLAATSRATETSWVERGRFVRERLLCQHLPPPPADVDMTVLNNESRTDPDSSCASCHLLVDPIGKGFDEFDELGRPRDTLDSGEMVPEVIVLGDRLPGTYESVPDLARAIADEPLVHRCYAEQWVEYALGESETCVVEDVLARFTEADLDLRDLLLAIVMNDAFRFQNTGDDQ